MLGHLDIPSGDTYTSQRTSHEESMIFCIQNLIHSEKRLKPRDWRWKLCHVLYSRTKVFKSVHRTNIYQLRGTLFSVHYTFREYIPCELVK